MHKEKAITLFFHIGVFLKGMDAVLELSGGLLVLLIPPVAISSVMKALTYRELLEDPHDVVAAFLLHAAQQYAITGSTFVAFYLFAHGLIKIVLVVGLLKNKIWAYPTALIVLGAFMLYQLYRFTFFHSLIMLGLTIFDFFVVWIIWREYLIQRDHLRASRNGIFVQS